MEMQTSQHMRVKPGEEPCSGELSPTLFPIKTVSGADQLFLKQFLHFLYLETLYDMAIFTPLLYSGPTSFWNGVC